MRRLLTWLRNPEIIGPPECPIMLRWSILAHDTPTTNSAEGQSQGKVFTLIRLPKWLTRDRKLMVHRFLPNVEDRDPHDHPRGFWTLVLRGSYFDLVPCPRCGGTGEDPEGPVECLGLTEGFWDAPGPVPEWVYCRGGLIVGDVMKAGTLRYRKPEHTHITQSGPKGAWTIVLMTPLAREWGFWRQGRFWPWKKYEAEFGFAMRCPTDEEMDGAMLRYTDALAKPKRSIELAETPPDIAKANEAAARLASTEARRLALDPRESARAALRYMRDRYRGQGLGVPGWYEKTPPVGPSTADAAEQAIADWPSHGGSE